MDNDTTYRMIVSFGVFIIGAIVTCVFWPRDKPQRHYDSPLLQFRKVDAAVSKPEVIETPVNDDNGECCYLCQWQEKNGVSAHDYGRLGEIIYNNYGQMNNSDLAKMVYLYCKENHHTGDKRMIGESTILEHLNDQHKLETKTFITLMNDAETIHSSDDHNTFSGVEDDETL